MRHRLDNIGVDLHQLRVLHTLLRERSLTRAAHALNVTQPALSKVLARLRRYFDDPLFVRIALHMEPTAKARELEAPVREILAEVGVLGRDFGGFDPLKSDRIFTFCVVDAGILSLLPALVRHLASEAPGVQLRAIPVDLDQLEAWLISGQVDFAMGSFPSLAKVIRRQHLWTETYASVVRRGHPRISSTPTLDQYRDEKHVLVSSAGIGHAHVAAERAIEAAVPRQNIVCRVPMFISAAHVAKHTDVIATLPRSTAQAMARDLDLLVVSPPIKLPRLEISQYWHSLRHREPAIKWIRCVFVELFRKNPPTRVAGC